MDTLNTLVQSVTVCDCRSRGFGFASWIGIQRVAGFLRWPIQRFRVSILDRHSKSCWVSLTINRRCITRLAWIGLDSALSRQSRLSLCKSVKKMCKKRQSLLGHQCPQNLLTASSALEISSFSGLRNSNTSRSVAKNIANNKGYEDFLQMVKYKYTYFYTSV